MQAIVFSGIQGSGKTTFFRERFASTHVLLSLDLLGTRTREDILLHACFAAQQPFVVDNTNPTSKARSRYARLAKASGFEAILYYFECATEDAIARNAARPEPQRVPDVAILGTAAKLELPDQTEGFDKIFRVRAHPTERRFEIEPIPR